MLLSIPPVDQLKMGAEQRNVQEGGYLFHGIDWFSGYLELF
jgi:hypothetical protein